MHRYLMYYGGVTDGDTLITMFGDLADLWERAAADGTPCARSSATTRSSSQRPSRRPTPAKQWIDKERARLNKAIEDAEREEKK